MLVPKVLAVCLLLAAARSSAEDTKARSTEEMVIGDIARQWSAMVDGYQRKQRTQRTHHVAPDLFPADLMMVMRKHAEDDVLNEISHDDHRVEEPASEGTHPDGKVVLVFLEKELELMDPDGSHSQTKLEASEPEEVILLESDPAPTCPATDADAEATTENELGAFLEDLDRFMESARQPPPPPPPQHPRDLPPGGNDIVAFLEGLVAMQAAQQDTTPSTPPEAWVQLLGPHIRRRRDARPDVQVESPAAPAASAEPEQLHPFVDDAEQSLAAPTDMLSGDVNLSGFKDSDVSDVINSIALGRLQVDTPPPTVKPEDPVVEGTTTTSPGWVIQNPPHQSIEVVKMVPVHKEGATSTSSLTQPQQPIRMVKLLPSRHQQDTVKSKTAATKHEQTAGKPRVEVVQMVPVRHDTRSPPETTTAHVEDLKAHIKAASKDNAALPVNVEQFASKIGQRGVGEALDTIDKEDDTFPGMTRIILPQGIKFEEAKKDATHDQVDAKDKDPVSYNAPPPAADKRLHPVEDTTGVESTTHSHNHVAKKELKAHDELEGLRMVESNNQPEPIAPPPQEEKLKVVEEDPIAFKFPASVGDLDAVRDLLDMHLQFEDDLTTSEKTPSSKSHQVEVVPADGVSPNTAEKTHTAHHENEVPATAGSTSVRERNHDSNNLLSSAKVSESSSPSPDAAHDSAIESSIAPQMKPAVKGTPSSSTSSEATIQAEHVPATTASHLAAHAKDNRPSSTVKHLEDFTAPAIQSPQPAESRLHPAVAGTPSPSSDRREVLNEPGKHPAVAGRPSPSSDRREVLNEPGKHPAVAGRPSSSSDRREVLYEPGKQLMPIEDNQQEQLDRQSFVRSTEQQGEQGVEDVPPKAEQTTQRATEASVVPGEAPNTPCDAPTAEPAPTSETFDLGGQDLHFMIQEPSTTPQPKKKKKKRKSLKLPFMVPTTTKAPWPRSLASLAPFLPFPDIDRPESQVRPPTQRPHRVAGRRFKAFAHPAYPPHWQDVEVATLPPLPALQPLQPHYHGHHHHHAGQPNHANHAPVVPAGGYNHVVGDVYQLGGYQQPDQFAMFQPQPEYQHQHFEQQQAGYQQQQGYQAPAYPLQPEFQYQSQPEYQQSVYQPQHGYQQSMYQPQPEYQQSMQPQPEFQQPAYQQKPEYQQQTEYQQSSNQLQPDYQTSIYQPNPEYQSVYPSFSDYQQNYQGGGYQGVQDSSMFQQQAYQPAMGWTATRRRRAAEEAESPAETAPRALEAVEVNDKQVDEQAAPESSLRAEQDLEHVAEQSTESKRNLAPIVEQPPLPETVPTTTLQSVAELSTQPAPKDVPRVEQPPLPEAVQQPPLPEAVQQPPLPEAVQQPPLPEAVEQPALQAAVEQPALPETLEQPALPEAVEQPALPETVEQPPIPETVEQPSIPEAVEQPLLPEAVAQPSPPEAVEQPPVAEVDAEAPADAVPQLAAQDDLTLTVDEIPEAVPEVAPATDPLGSTLPEDNDYLLDMHMHAPPRPRRLRHPPRLAPLHASLAADLADSPELARRARNQDAAESGAATRKASDAAVGTDAAADAADAFSAAAYGMYGHRHRPPHMPPALEDLIPKSGETEEERAEREQKAVQRMIQVVNVLGSLQSFLSDRARTVVRRLSKIVEEEEEQKLT